MSVKWRQWKHDDLPERWILSPPASDLCAVVIIPAYAEPDVLPVIQSLQKCKTTDHPVECIILINEPTGADQVVQDINQKTFTTLTHLAHELPESVITFYFFYIKDIPPDLAGVGYARQMAMEEAYRRFAEIGRAKEGVIISLDADCTVSGDYLHTICRTFTRDPKMDALNLYYEHPVERASGFTEIVEYELHLRYFINMQRWLRLPFAYHTVGSSMAVRASAYRLIGGMNRRKAGEDFYFLHKFSKRGTLHETGACTVYPSGRSSDRVPFGTGRVVEQMRMTGASMMTYHPQSFRDLKGMLTMLPAWFDDGVKTGDLISLPSPVKNFLQSQHVDRVTAKLRKNTTRFDLFVKAFFQWFDAFKLMKYLHHARNETYPSIPVLEAVLAAGEELRIPADLSSPIDALHWFRALDRGANYRGLNAVQALYQDLQ